MNHNEKIIIINKKFVYNYKYYTRRESNPRRPLGRRPCYHYTTRVKRTTTVGFEPTRPKDNALAGRRVNHSAKLSQYHYQSYSDILVIKISLSYCTLIINLCLNKLL